MAKFIDLTGQRFGRLVVVSRAENVKGSKPRFLCQCDCGGCPIVKARNLKAGYTQSCGCLRKELTIERCAIPANRTPTHDALYEQYCTKRKSTLELGEMYEVATNTVNRWLRAYSIPIRDNATAVSISQRQKEAARTNLRNLTPEQKAAGIEAVIAAGGLNKARARAAQLRAARGAISVKCPICEQRYKTLKNRARKMKTCGTVCGNVLAQRTKAENREWNRKYAYIAGVGV